ncbi:MAG: hypothetical protein J0I42_14865 [Bosea sp.]|uniref:hypothetical protein n=1 Tax=Bosea sp. (in: a-proteobacteria) TaxID=1871050 RepID=UPI001AC3142D|nr:hypothetical protein [Bosea sp. (in: a-proteobacteria)]MBN9453227.1 hypothetical protein [Bosea sp. (in: a-proteobacteria)]
MTGQKSGKVGVTSPQACPEKALDFLRGLYPSKTIENVAYDTGIPSDTVRKWFEGVAKPSWAAFSRLIFAYGPAFLIAVYPKAPAWLDEAHRRERQEALRAEQRRIQEQLDALGA